MNAVSTKDRFAHEVIPTLVERITHKDRERLVQTRDKLVVDNQALGGPHLGFMLGGIFHSPYDAKTQAKAPKKPLHASLRDRGNAYLDELKQFHRNSERLVSGLSLVLRPCNTWQDVRDALPDLVKDELPELRSLSRSRPSGYTLAEQPLQKHQFDLTVDLIAFYIANRMLY